MKRHGLLFLVVVLIAASRPATTQAQDIAAGWDLFSTDPGTTFGPIPFEGAPLGSFDFGGTVGVQDVGDTDTIIRRLDDATFGGPATIDIELVALQ